MPFPWDWALPHPGAVGLALVMPWAPPAWRRELAIEGPGAGWGGGRGCSPWAPSEVGLSSGSLV